MARLTRLTAALLAALVVLAVATPAVLASEPATISVDQGETTYTVTVDHNGTAVNNTSVVVEPTDSNASYSGADGFTDVNGTVTFDLPENETEVNISTTYNGTEVTTTETLKAANETTWDGQGPFGRWVSKMVDKLRNMDLDGPLGQHVSAIVTENNPGADNRSTAANPGGNGNGPPDHAGNNSDGGNGGGPPDHAGNGNNGGGPDKAGGDDDGEEDEESEA